MESMDTEIETAVAEMDPNTIVELMVHDSKNAGQTPNSRWGKIAFDDKGDAKLKLPLKDVELLHHLKWLSPEDQAKYLGFSQAAPTKTVEAEAQKLMSENDALRAANTVLASKNAQLEADGAALKMLVERMQKETDDLKAQAAALDASFKKLVAEVGDEAKPDDAKDTKSAKKGK